MKLAATCSSYAVAAVSALYSQGLDLEIYHTKFALRDDTHSTAGDCSVYGTTKCNPVSGYSI